MRVLITGAGGQLGRDLTALCARSGDDVVALDRVALDIAAADAVQSTVSHHRPEVIFNCAAWTAVDACEDDPERADLINGTAVGFLADAAARWGAHLVQVSTDYVFDGDKATPYTEVDEPAPRSAYGRSKLLGEQLAGDDATIVRTSYVCSAHGGNMVATVLRLIDSHPTLRFVTDQRGRPTFTTDLAQALRSLGLDRRSGVYHVANHGAVSWFEFVQAILELSGEDPTRVEPMLTAEMDPPRPAPRPANSVLATDRYEALGYAPLRHFREPLAEVLPAYR